MKFHPGIVPPADRRFRTSMNSTRTSAFSQGFKAALKSYLALQEQP